MVVMTKNCIHPWKTISVLGDGMVAPCCGNVRGDYGNVKTDLIDKNADDSDVFMNADYKRLRESLLTGNLFDECKNCRAVAEEDVPVELLRNEVEDLLEANGINPRHADLLTAHSIQSLIVSITNKCNLRCVYCPQSAPKSRSTDVYLSSIEFYKAFISEPDFLNLLSYLHKRGLKWLSFVGLGELTIYRNWQRLIKSIKESFPDLHLSIVSNFAIPFCDEDIEALMVFDQIQVSCDTIDKELFAQIRVGAELSVLLENLDRLLKKRGHQTAPAVVFNVTLYDLMIEKLPDLARYAIKNNIDLNFSNLFEAQGTVASKTKMLRNLTEVPDEKLLKVWEVLNALPRRMKAGNPKSEINQIGPIYGLVRQRVGRITPSLFSPKSELFSSLPVFSAGSNTYLRNIFIGFDEKYEGVYMPINEVKRFQFGHLECKITPILVKERGDRNLLIQETESYQVSLSGEVIFDASCEDGNFTHVLFAFQKITTSNLILNKKFFKVRKLGIVADKFVRETILIQDVGSLLMELSRKYPSFYLWGAGARTKTLFDWSLLGQLPISEIIDSDPNLTGSRVNGIKIVDPISARGFRGPVLISNATNPYAIEQFILSNGYGFSECYII